MAKQPMKKPVAKMKTSAKPKANPSKDYMKPVGGTKQEGYKAPGSVLNWNDQKSGTQRNWRAKTGESASKKMSILGALTAEGITAGTKYLKTGINPTAMKATAGNPKPTSKQLAAGKKASADAKARATARAKAKAAADKAAKLKAAKTAKKPTTGVYKRNQG